MNHREVNIRRTKVRLALSFAIAGGGLIAALFWLQDFPDLRLWALFSAAFVFLEFRSVYINDRLSVSASVMVALTAAVAFGRGSAVLGVATMAALAIFSAADFRERRWFEPIVNFGQFVVTATASIAVLELFLPETVKVGNLWQVALGAAAASTVYGAINFNIVRWIVRKVFDGPDVRPWAGMGITRISYLSMGFLGGLLGATYLLVGAVTLPLILTVFFAGHMTFASYGQLREAQEATLRGFIKALEAKDLYTRGHTERVAYFSQIIGEEMGFTAEELQRLRWAALIHDVGKLAVPRELIRKNARLTDEEYSQMQRHVHLVEDLLSEVEFLHPMIQIASGHHTHFDGNGYGGSGHAHGKKPGRDTCVLAVADAFDAMTSSRSYRMALSQEYAFEELRRNAGSQFDPEAVEALDDALERRGERYGSADLHSDEEARRLAETLEGYRIYG